MNTKLTKKDTSIYEIEAKVEKEAWKEAQEKALKKLAQKVTIKGFRQGKAPIELAKERINPSELINQAINEALPELYNSALREHKLVPYTQPKVNVTELNDDGFTAVFEVTTAPEVTLGQYKDINVPLEKRTATKKEIQEEIDHVLEDNAELVIKDGAAEKGDTVVFDFKGYIDGKEFDGGSANNYSLVLGSNQFIPGFEDQLIGVTSETKKDVIVTFPEQYVKELAGKEAKFVCMIHEIKTKQRPELNDEFVSTLNIKDVKNVEEFKAYQAKQVQNRLDNQARQEQFNKVLAKIIENAKFEIGADVINQEVKAMKENTINQITSNGLTYEQYKEITGLSDEKLEENFKVEARKRLEQYLVFQKIAQVENLVVSRQELEDYYNQLATNYGMKVDEIKNIYKNDEGRVISTLVENKIVRFISANNIQETKSDKKVEEVKEEKPADKKEEKPAAKKPRAKKTTSTTTKKTTKTAKKEVSEENK